MGHEALIYGVIVGSRGSGEEFRLFQEKNVEAINQLVEDSDWPWVDKSIFALPGPHPQGTYRNQVIHFGLSIKEDGPGTTWWCQWLEKFESVLRRLHWSKARVFLESDFGKRFEIEWTPTDQALGDMFENKVPIKEWTRADADDWLSKTVVRQ